MPYGTWLSQAIVPVTPTNGLASNAPDGLALKLSVELLGPEAHEVMDCGSSTARTEETTHAFDAIRARTDATCVPVLAAIDGQPCRSSRGAATIQMQTSASV